MSKLFKKQTIGGNIGIYSENGKPNGDWVEADTTDGLHMVDDPGDVTPDGMIELFDVKINPPTGDDEIVKEICRSLGVPENHLHEDAMYMPDENDESRWMIPFPVKHAVDDSNLVKVATHDRSYYISFK